MSTDPRLASVELLTMAVMLAKKRQREAPERTVTLQVIYAAGLDPDAEPEYEGETYTYTLPPDAAGAVGSV